MRARDERCVADQRHAADRDARRFQIEDRLKNDLRRAVHQRGKLRGEQRRGVALDAFDQLRADQRRRDRQAMAAAAGIGAKRPQRGLVGRSKPDEMAAALASVPLRHRHRDRQQEFAVREAEHHAPEHQFVQLRRKLMRLDHAAPCDVTGVARREVGAKLAAHGRMQPVGSHSADRRQPACRRRRRRSRRPHAVRTRSRPCRRHRARPAAPAAAAARCATRRW